MSGNRDKELIEHALKRQRGMDPEKAEALTREVERKDDWYANCPQCGERVTGTIAQLKEHRCAKTST